MALLRSSARPKLAEPTGYDSPARAELALAIATRDELRRGIANLWDADQRYDLLAYIQKVENANAALGLAKADASAKIIDGALAGDATVLNSDAIRQARTDWQAARDDLDAAREAHGQLRPRREKMEQDAKDADSKVAELAAAVLREHPAVKTVLAEHMQARTHYLETLSLLAWMDRNGVTGNRDAYGYRLDTEQAVATDRTLRQATEAPDVYAIRSTAAKWKAAHDALQTDARAPLPDNGGHSR